MKRQTNRTARKNAGKMGSLTCRCSSNDGFASRAFYPVQSNQEKLKAVDKFLQGDSKPQYSSHAEVTEGYGCICRVESGRGFRDRVAGRPNARKGTGRILGGVTSIQVLPKEGYGDQFR